MIGALTGTVLHALDHKVILDVGGVGYEVFVPRSLPARLPLADQSASIRLYIYTHFKENDLRLFGFADLKTRQLFAMLLGVSGIGPQIALTIVDSMSVEAFYQKIYTGDSGDLCRIKGIGKKTAERLVLELKDKIAATVLQFTPGAPRSLLGIADVGSTDAATEDALAALISLGYSQSEALSALNKIPSGQASSGEKLKVALGVLSRR